MRWESLLWYLELSAPSTLSTLARAHMGTTQGVVEPSIESHWAQMQVDIRVDSKLHCQRG